MLQQQEQIRQGNNGLAVAGMILGIVSCVPFFWLFLVPAILAVIFGHVALHAIKKTGQPGRGFAIAALATGWTSLAGWIIFMSLAMIGSFRTGPEY